jgi:hypothetical protein
MTIGPFFTYRMQRVFSYPAKPGGDLHIGVHRCMGCNRILWRRPRLLTSPLPASYHHACLHRWLLAHSAKTGLAVISCFICGLRP